MWRQSIQLRICIRIHYFSGEVAREEIIIILEFTLD